MPQYGTLDVAAALDGAPTLAALRHEPWTLPGAQLVQLNVEVESGDAVKLIPPALHPSIPPYVTFTVTRFPESPVGAFCLAQVRLVARAGIRPRGFLLGAVVDSADAAEALGSGWGYRCRVGEVALAVRHDRWEGTARLDGREVLRIACVDPQVINGSDIELFDTLTMAKADDEPGGAVIAQVDPEYTYKEAYRGRAAVTVFDGPAWLGHSLLVPEHEVVAVACTVDTDLPSFRFVIDPSRPAVEGTRRIQTS